jgi:hypothetical protein
MRDRLRTGRHMSPWERRRCERPCNRGARRMTSRALIRQVVRPGRSDSINEWSGHNETDRVAGRVDDPPGKKDGDIRGGCSRGYGERIGDGYSSSREFVTVLKIHRPPQQIPVRLSREAVAALALISGSKGEALSPLCGMISHVKREVGLYPTLRAATVAHEAVRFRTRELPFVDAPRHPSLAVCGLEICIDPA